MHTTGPASPWPPKASPPTSKASPAPPPRSPPLSQRTRPNTTSSSSAPSATVPCWIASSRNTSSMSPPFAATGRPPSPPSSTTPSPASVALWSSLAPTNAAPSSPCTTCPSRSVSHPGHGGPTSASRTTPSLFVTPGRFLQPEPRVRYRGIFLNDEAPSLSGWAKEKFGGYNHLFYTHVFELLLRLKANYLWPAMWGSAFQRGRPARPRARRPVRHRHGHQPS